mgnify:CR=1 FL=1
MKLFNKIAIVGVGLIGGSIGLAVKNKKLAIKVIGIGHHQKSITQALKVKAIDEGFLDINKVKGADLIILATPPQAIIDIFPKLSKLIGEKAIVIDVGSTKEKILEAASKAGINFIGCHPLAGLEKKGPENASANIFDGSICLLAPLKKTPNEAVKKIRILWKTLGAKTKVIDARSHDKILAFVSHLPHAVVFSLMDCIDKDDLKFASTGLKDTSRIASSDPAIWRDIFLTNKKELLLAINKFKKSISRIEFLVKKGRSKGLALFIEKSRNKRNAF